MWGRKQKIGSFAAMAIFLALAGGSLYLYFGLYPQAEIPIPEVGRDLPSNVSVADEEFRSRVATRYVAPMPASKLVEQLRSEGFTVDEKSGRATFTEKSLVCLTIWSVHWEAEDGIVTRITGLYGLSCL